MTLYSTLPLQYDQCANSWHDVFNILQSLYMSTFKWKNLPDGVNAHFMEKIIFNQKSVTFFHDVDLVSLDRKMDGFVTLHGVIEGQIDIYSEPIKLRMIAPNGYNIDKTNHLDCVIIYDNMMRVSPIPRLIWYAKRIFNADLTIDLNIHAQKTPFLLACNDKSVELSIRNIYKQMSEFKEAIIFDKDIDFEGSIKVHETNAPYVADKVEENKRKIWNEALSFIGIENNSSEKRERLTADEVLISNGLAMAHKNDRMMARQIAIDEINEMFNLNIEVEFNNEIMKDVEATIGAFEGGEDNE